MNIDDEFDRFVREHFVTLCRTGYLLCGDRQRAEDAVQDALLRLHRHWRRVDNRLAYVRRALVTIVVDQARRPWRHEVPTEITHDRRTADASGTVDDWSCPMFHIIAKDEHGDGSGGAGIAIPRASEADEDS